MMWKHSVLTCFKILFRTSSGGTKECFENINGGGHIKTLDLPNVKQVH
jgi:hypothetical protein